MNARIAVIAALARRLTAAYEFLKRTDIKPIVFEQSGALGESPKPNNYKGNRIDLGGHRFFSKSDRVMNWWFNILPLQGAPAAIRRTDHEIEYATQVVRSFWASLPASGVVATAQKVRRPAPDPEKETR